MEYTHYCIKCNNQAVQHDGEGTLQIVCPHCRYTQSLFRCKSISGMVGAEFSKDSYKHHCHNTSCYREVGRSDGDMEFMISCRYCKTVNHFVKSAGIVDTSELFATSVRQQRLKKKLIPSA